MPQPENMPPSQHLLARALYDNVPDTPDELAFRREDTLIVLEQNTGNIEGWWLCSLRGRQGICPANRLRLIPGVYNEIRVSSPSHFTSELSTSTTTSSSNNNTKDFHYLQRQGKRRSWQIQPNQVVTPKKFNDVYLYDLPPSRCSPIPITMPSLSAYPSPVQIPGQECYDVPPRAIPIIGGEHHSPNITGGSGGGSSSGRLSSVPSPLLYTHQQHQQQSPQPLQTRSSDPSLLMNHPHHQHNNPSPNNQLLSLSMEAYDVPRALHLNPNNQQFQTLLQQQHHNHLLLHHQQQQQLTPSSSASSLFTTGDSQSSSNRSSLALMADYDVPRSHQKCTTSTGFEGGGGRGESFTGISANSPIQCRIKELPLELSSALETLERLQSDSAGAISRLLEFVGPHWRQRDRLAVNLMEIKLASVRLRTSLHDLREFSEGALGNASRASDKNLASKLSPLVCALQGSDALVTETCERLDECQWSLDQLSIKEVNQDKKNNGDDNADNEDQIMRRTTKPNALDQLVACARTLTDDIQQIASFIQGNGLLLFKKDHQGVVSRSSGELNEEYDYVSLDSRENDSRKNEEFKKTLPKDLQSKFDLLAKRADEVTFDEHSKMSLAADDKQVLTFFGGQVVTHHRDLTLAIDAFLHTVERNQPPKVFLVHGKFVVLSAHKLVHIGDTVHRNVTCKVIKSRALECANALSDALATSVTKTKMAAQQFPSVNAVQEMVDSVVDISYTARDLKVCLVQAASQT